MEINVLLFQSPRGVLGAVTSMDRIPVGYMMRSARTRHRSGLREINFPSRQVSPCLQAGSVVDREERIANLNGSTETCRAQSTLSQKYVVDASY